MRINKYCNYIYLLDFDKVQGTAISQLSINLIVKLKIEMLRKMKLFR